MPLDLPDSTDEAPFAWPERRERPAPVHEKTLPDGVVQLAPWGKGDWALILLSPSRQPAGRILLADLSPRRLSLEQAIGQVESVTALKGLKDSLRARLAPSWRESLRCFLSGPTDAS